MREVFWNLFAVTGHIEAYLLYKQSVGALLSTWQRGHDELNLDGEFSYEVEGAHELGLQNESAN